MNKNDELPVEVQEALKGFVVEVQKEYHAKLAKLEYRTEVIVAWIRGVVASLVGITIGGVAIFGVTMSIWGILWAAGEIIKMVRG